MSDWGQDVLQRLRLRKGLTQTDLAAEMGMSPAWVAKQEAKGAFDDPPRMHAGTVKKLAVVLGASMDDLRGAAPHVPADLVAQVRSIERKPPSDAWLGKDVAALPDIPILSTTVEAGPAKANVSELKPIGVVPRALFPWDPSAFCLEVTGDSMVPWVTAGDLVMASPGVAHWGGFSDGAECIVLHREAMDCWNDCLKRVFKWGENQLRLESWNPAHKVRIVESRDVEIIPVVLRICRDYRRMDIDLTAMPLPVPQRKHPVGEEPQQFPDYDGPQAAPEE